MLILARRRGETVVLGKDGSVSVTVLSIINGEVRLGFRAPKALAVHREEVWAAIQNTRTPATDSKAVPHAQ